MSIRSRVAARKHPGPAWHSVVNDPGSGPGFLEATSGLQEPVAAEPLQYGTLELWTVVGHYEWRITWAGGLHGKVRKNQGQLGPGFGGRGWCKAMAFGFSVFLS
jgi:hypothetical protein